MCTQNTETVHPDSCEVYDFQLIVARKTLAAYGVTAEDLQEPEPCQVVEFEASKERALARSVLKSCKITPELQTQLSHRYESTSASMQQFFELSGFNPPEHGDISF